MKIIDLDAVADREHRLDQIGRSDWRAGRYLYEVLRDGRLKSLYGEARAFSCGVVQITASDMGVLLYTDFGFVRNGNFMQYKL